MKNKIDSILDYLLDQKRRFLLFSLGFGILMILYFLVPFYITHTEKETNLISGFASFFYLNDRQDSLYYATMMNIMSLSFSSLIVLISFLGFYPDENRIRITKRILPFLFLLKLVSDILMLVFSFQTKTNVEPCLGSEMEIAFSLLFFVLYLFVAYPKKKKATEKR